MSQVAASGETGPFWRVPRRSAGLAYDRISGTAGIRLRYRRVVADVNLRLRGGPYDRQNVKWDVPDADDPPMAYELRLHGPHEAAEIFEYRRAERAPDGAWIYEAPDVGTR